MRCPRCHSENPDDSRFCGSCASPLASEARPTDSLTRTLEPPVRGLVEGVLVADKYRIIGEIGRGGMGIVYRAEDTKLKRAVALKFLPHQWTADPEVRERFAHEAQAASALDDPNICNVHEIGETADGRMYIAMACYEGESLRERLKKSPLGTDEAIEIASQAARGMAKAHQKGIVHRDLKPANILITNDGVAKIVDFGLAKLAGQVRLTREGTTIGTIAYMSPEQARGQAVDHRTDIWSLGVVLYEMIAGRLPFKGENDASMIRSIINDEPAPLAKIRNDLPAGFERIVHKALAKDPGDRYESMEDLRKDLSAVAEGLKPLRAKRGWLQGRILGFKKTYFYPGLVAVVLLAVLAILFLPARRGQAIDSVAVMPLENLSGDPDQDSLAESIHDDLITNLAGIGGLKTVIARRTVMRFKGKDTPPQQIAQELRVKALITGTMRRSGDNVLVTAQMIDPATGSQTWGDRYERNIRDVLSLGNAIVAAITREMGLPLTSPERTRLAAERPVDPEAYVAYTKGRFYLNMVTLEGLKKGLEYMQQAIDKDPANPLPYAALALGYCRIGHSTEPPPDAFVKAKAAARKAEELGGSLADTESALAQIKIFEDWDWAGAERSLQRAIALNPSLSDALRMYAWYLFILGKNDEAIATMKRAIEVDPLMALWSADLGWQYESTGRIQEAMDAVQKSLELNPKLGQALNTLGHLYVDQGKFEDAIAVHQKLAVPGSPYRWSIVRTLALAGRTDEARKKLAEFLQGKPEPTGFLDGWFLPEVYVALGDKEEAFRWLEAGVRERTTFIPWIRNNPRFASLRSDPRFEQLARRMNLPGA